jgi:GntR family transcriptional regulator, gluconate operon transcriptional repressor
MAKPSEEIVPTTEGLADARLAAEDDQLGLDHIGVVVARRLRNQIISGELAPGERLREVELATRFGVSRGPIRDALKELARESLVVALPRRGAVVSGMTAADIEEVYAVREALELLALRLASDRAPDQELLSLKRFLVGMEDAVRNRDMRALISADLGFHRGICQASRNRRLLVMWEELALQCAAIIGLSATVEERMARGVDRHHDEVLESLRKRDAARAGEILGEHFERSQELILAAMDKGTHRAPEINRRRGDLVAVAKRTRHHSPRPLRGRTIPAEEQDREADVGTIVGG